MRQKLFVLAFLLLGTASSFAADSDFQATVNNAIKDFTSALDAKDATKLSALYAEDGIIYPPNGEKAEGREAIGAFWKSLMDAGLKGEIVSVEAQSDGDFGLDTGTFKIFDADGKEIDHGKYVVVWKKQSGKWMMYRDIWNSNIPAPQAQ